MIRMSRREGRREGDPQLFEAYVPEMLIDMLQEESRLENLGNQIAPVCITASVWIFFSLLRSALRVIFRGVFSSSKVVSFAVPQERSPAEHSFVPEEG